MNTKETIMWLKIMRANLKNFPEVSNSKKIEALTAAIDIIEAYEAFIDPSVSDKESYKKFEKMGKKHWLDNADSWICPICGFETGSPTKYEGCKCPKCGFQDDKDKLEQEPILDKLRAEINTLQHRCYALTKGVMCAFCKYECEYKAESEDKE